MEYLIAGICVIICIAVIIWGLKVFKENRKLGPKKGEDDDDEDELRRLRP